jgi:predicted  nucleic acid-binding Zn-ribbon protein
MHKCIRCGSVYPDNDASILRGCSCGSIFFLFMKNPQDAQQIQEIKQELETKDTTLEQELFKKIEEKKSREVKKLRARVPKEVREKIKRIKKKEIEFGIETVRIPKEGMYEINIDALMQRRPLIILEKGRVYFIHLPSLFEKVKRRA